MWHRGEGRGAVGKGQKSGGEGRRSGREGVDRRELEGRRVATPRGRSHLCGLCESEGGGSARLPTVEMSVGKRRTGRGLGEGGVTVKLFSYPFEKCPNPHLAALWGSGRYSSFSARTDDYSAKWSRTLSSGRDDFGSISTARDEIASKWSHGILGRDEIASKWSRTISV